MDLNILGLGTAGEIAAIGAVVGAVTQFLKGKSWINNKVLPWISTALGAAAGVGVFAYMGDASYINGAVLGALTGAGTSGAFDGLKPLVQKVATALQNKKAAKVQAAQDSQDAAIQAAVAEILAEQNQVGSVASGLATAEPEASATPASEEAESNAQTE